MTIDVRIAYRSGMKVLKVRPQVLIGGVWQDDHMSYHREIGARGDEAELCVHNTRRIIVEEVPDN